MQTKENVLITGGTGMIGRYLSVRLLEEGYEVTVLSRSKNVSGKVKTSIWDIESNIIDHEVLGKADHIIHLAGANIGQKRWTGKRRKIIMDSRTRPAALLLDYFLTNNHQLKTFISSSATGYYGSKSSDRIFKESDPPADDFLGQVCQQWEESADKFKETGARVVKIRTGVVLSEKGGVIKKLLPVFKIGLGSSIGSGSQFMPWIHIFDLCEIFIKSIRDKDIQGPYNAVSPDHQTNKEFSRSLAKILGRPFWLPGIPAVFLRLAFGDMADIILHGSRVSSQKILDTGFVFRFNDLEKAISDLVK